MKPPKGKPRELPPEGTHQAILYSIVDVGTQHNVTFNSKSRKVWFQFELVGPGLKNSEGNPFFMSKEYTFSAKSKNLLKDLKSWQGVKDKDLSDIEIDAYLGKRAALTIQYTEDEQYANITAIAPLMKGTKELKGTAAMSSFYLDEYDEDAFKALPQWLQNKIAASDEYPDIVAEQEGNTKGKGKAAAGKAKGKK